MSKYATYFFLLLMASLLVWPASLSAEENTVYISLFYGTECTRCAQMKEFLFNTVKPDFPNVEIKMYEYHQAENAQLMREVSERLDVRVTGVPFLVIGEETVSGYLNDETTGARIYQIVKLHTQIGCHDIVAEILEESSEGQECETEQDLGTITLPLIGEINVGSWSLPLLTIAIAAIDGFNPCAMWVLLFLISLLLGMKNRRRMWTLGIVFIAASAAVYFLFLAAWLNLFLFLGFIGLIRIIIGLVAVASGGYHLREYWVNKASVCRVTGGKRQRLLDKIKDIIEGRAFWLALLGVIILAGAVNLIELVCSAGLPAIYTQVLALSNLSTVVYYLYLLLYVLVFMFDDMAIFAIAMGTLKMVGLDAKYSRWSNLIGGAVILILGILLLFKPGWIMFG